MYDSTTISRLAIHKNHGYQIVRIEDIIYCKGEGRYTRLHLVDGKELISTKILGFVENTLPSNKFFRIHKSYIVNIDFVDKLNTSPKKSVILRNGEEIVLSTRRSAKFLSFVSGNYNIL